MNFLLVGPLALALLRLVLFERGGRSHLVRSFFRGSAVLNAQRLREGEVEMGSEFFVGWAFGPCIVTFGVV